MCNASDQPRLVVVSSTERSPGMPEAGRWEQVAGGRGRCVRAGDGEEGEGSPEGKREQLGRGRKSISEEKGMACGYVRPTGTAVSRRR